MTVQSLSMQVGMIKSLVDTRLQMFDLQRQLGTGKIADTYSKLDSVSRISILSLRSEAAATEGYQRVIKDVDTRTEIVEISLTRFISIASTVKSDVYADGFILVDGKQTAVQRTASASLDEMLSLLNSDVNGRHLFAGRDNFQRPIEPTELILNGDAKRAGVNQLIRERIQADLGIDGLGRLQFSAVTNKTMTLNEEQDGIPFGLKIEGATSTTPAIVTTAPAGTPKSMDVEVQAQPSHGDKLTVHLKLPDGNDTKIVLTASTDHAPPRGHFKIGDTMDDTAANLNTTLRSQLERLVHSELHAVSSMIASEDFFNATELAPPQRIAGLSFNGVTQIQEDTPATAIGTVDGLTPATTMASLGFAVGDQVTVQTGSGTNTYTAAAGHTINELLAALDGGAAGVSASLDADGAISIIAGDNSTNITMGEGSQGTNLASLGFTTTPVAPTNPQVAAMAGTFSVTVNGGTATNVNLTTTQTKAALETALAGLANVAASINSQGFVQVSPLAPTDTIEFSGGSPIGLATGSEPDPHSATTLVAGTTDDNVIWYHGEIGAESARKSAVAKIDENHIVDYGTRADEPAIRATLSALTALSSADFDKADPHVNARYEELAVRVGDTLSFKTEPQSLNDILADITVTRNTLHTTNERHIDSAALLERLLGDRENADQNEVAAQLLTLQTRLQASLQTTSLLAQLSIVNYL